MKIVTLLQEGELWVKGPNVFGGYFKAPDKTKETFSSDGYFKTGDIFKVDKYGNYFCVDRLKELIKYSKQQTFGISTFASAWTARVANRLTQRVSRSHRPS